MLSRLRIGLNIGILRQERFLDISQNYNRAMATPNGHETPTKQLSQASVLTPSPGKWRHPKFDEIARRQNANNFDDRSIRQITWNSGALLLIWLFSTNFGIG